LSKQPIPSDHAKHICVYHEADKATVTNAIDGALSAKAEWEAMPWNDRAAIFLKAANLISGKYRYKLMAATMIGQGKNIWQAEIDAAAEVHYIDLASHFHSRPLFAVWTAGRLFQVRRQIRGGVIFSATAQEYLWHMEVRRHASRQMSHPHV
jgi:acyl-CoA reductase-like NAD-dependent aldehyde dehydrogenase